MNAADLLRLVGARQGAVDVACPLCGPDRSSEANRRRKVLRVWRGDNDFVSWCCARCGASGWAIPDNAQRSTKRSEAKPAPIGATPEQRTADALALWHAARSPVGTIVVDYLAGRHLHLPDEVLVGGAIRFHPRCPFGKERLPCMLALFTDAITGEPRGVHRTALTPDGAKIDRKAFGPIGGCIIRLWPDEAVAQGLVIGEGIETTLAAATRVAHRGTLLQPAWAAGFAGNMKSFPVMPGIDALTLLVDHDASEAGQKAAAACAGRWTAAGREAVRLTPRLPGDFNDIVADVRR